jgi:hypothetical protein|tara:strand:- start:1108 stop:1392 length:285 start_codon:yes stop_codon:yes gene_type:complete
METNRTGAPTSVDIAPFTVIDWRDLLGPHYRRGWASAAGVIGLDSSDFSLTPILARVVLGVVATGLARSFAAPSTPISSRCWRLCSASYFWAKA